MIFFFVNKVYNDLNQYFEFILESVYINVSFHNLNKKKKTLYKKFLVYIFIKQHKFINSRNNQTLNT